MGDKKLIFLDIDGTLIPKSEVWPPESAMRAIRAARDAGHKVFINTGRSTGMLTGIERDKYDGVVASVGGYIEAEGNVIYDRPMTDEEFKKQYNALKEGGVLCTVETGDAVYGDDASLILGRVSAPWFDRNESFWLKRAEWVHRLGMRPIEEYDGAPVYKNLIIYREPKQLLPARRAVEETFNFCLDDTVTGNWLVGELINREFSKGTAIHKLCAYYGIPVEDSIAFGDGMNDLEMMEMAGISVCMENGSEYLKSRSTYVCPDVLDDGLLKGFKSLKIIPEKL
ncbi:MAG: HAD family hydrolase [Lachnospiraceae bacterium]|nr:HAD family hydrolase [Lachnospiraceae bacterium]